MQKEQESSFSGRMRPCCCCHRLHLPFPGAPVFPPLGSGSSRSANPAPTLPTSLSASFAGLPDHWRRPPFLQRPERGGGEVQDPAGPTADLRGCLRGSTSSPSSGLPPSEGQSSCLPWFALRQLTAGPSRQHHHQQGRTRRRQQLLLLWEPDPIKQVKTTHLWTPACCLLWGRGCSIPSVPVCGGALPALWLSPGLLRALRQGTASARKAPGLEGGFATEQALWPKQCGNILGG